MKNFLYQAGLLLFDDKKNEILSSFWDSVKGGSQTAFDLYNYGPKGPPKEVVEQRAMEAQQQLEIIKNDLQGVEIESLGESGIASTELCVEETIDLISSFMKKVESVRAEPQ
mgnify:CR=1 FL=1